MLSTESFVGARALGEESSQMWDLNKRLEAYLARVKFLEEENEVLRAEIQSAKSGPAGDSWRVKYEEELRALRDALGQAFREKCTAELARDNLYEEVQQVKSRCQKEQAAREEAKKLLALSKKELEEERRAQIWLKERAVQLEKEVESLLEAHEEEKAGLDQEIASFSQSLESFRCAPVAFQPVEVEDYSKRLSEIWKGAVETYKTEVSQLEGSLCQAKENLWKAVEDNQQSQLRLQHLEKDLAGLKVRKEMLEESLARQWQEQRGEAEKFQLAMEALEQEKQTLRVQIAQVLEDRQQLMHLKMSLSLEVATYRTLLEAESTRLQMPPSDYKLVASGLRDVKLEASASTEARRLPPRASPSVFSRARAQSDALSPKSQSSSARELQKINSGLQKINLGLQKISSGLHAAAPQAAGAIREVVAPGRPTPSASWSSKAAPSLSLEPPSPVPPEPGSPGGEGPAWPGGEEDEVIQEMENPPLGAATETCDAKTELLGEAPTRSLRYPAQLVSEALEDALKEMKDDAQPKEEPTLSTTWAPQDPPSPTPHTESCRGTWNGEAPPEDARDGEALEAEEKVGEAELQGLGMESSTGWDGAAAPLGSHPCGTAASAASQEEMEAWEEEMPAALSPREAEAASQEEDTGISGQTETGWEEPEERDNEADAPHVEDLHPLEEEEDRGPHSPRGEDGDCQGEATDARDGETPQREVRAAGAAPVESHPVLLTESHLEEDLVDGQEEKFEHREMCETELAADEETGQEMSPEEDTCPEPEPFSIHEAIPAEDASLEAEEDAAGEEEPGRAGEEVEASGEVLGGEDTWAGEASGPEIPSPEDWEVTAEDAEGPLGTEEPAWAGDTLTSAGGPESEGRDGALPSELEETWEDDEDAESQGMRQQQPPPEAEPAPGLARGEQESTVGAPGQGDNQEPGEALEEMWEMQDEDDELSSELGQLGSSSSGPTVLQPVPGEPMEKEVAERWGELEKTPGRSVELEDTLPDSTSFHLYDGERLDGVTPNQNPSEAEETMEATAESEIALEETEKTMEAAPKSEIDLEEAEETTEETPEPRTALEEAEETTETASESKTALEEAEETTETALESKTALEEAEETTEETPEPQTALEEAEETTEETPEPQTALEEAEETTEETPEPQTALEEAEEMTEAAPEPQTALEEAEETMETALESKTALEEAEETTKAAPESKIALEEAEENTETARESKISPEDEGWLDESNKPPTPTMPESHEEEVGTEVAPAAESAEEEEGYFMVSAPNREMSTSEEAEISEDFEEIQVEETRASKDDLEALGEASPVPEDEGHFEALVGEADEDMKMLTEEPDMPKGEDEDDAEDFSAELEEGPAVPEADPGSPGATGLIEEDTDEPAQVTAGSDEHEGSEYSEGLATKLVEELGDVVEPENDAGGAETLRDHNLELVGLKEEEKEENEEEEKEEEEMEEDEPSVAHPNVAEPTPPAELQVMPVSPVPDQAEQPSDEQPRVEEEAPDGHSPSLAGEEELPEPNPTQMSFPEVIKDNPEVTGDIMKDSDILEIVEQALEFNQELVMGARVAKEEEQQLSGTELPQDTGEDSSPASSSEEEPTVQEAPVDAAPGMESLARAENGLHREASLEDLSEFTEEALNGIAAVPPAQEFPAETGEPMPPQPPSPGDATTTTTKLVDATPRGKRGGADIVPLPSPLGDDVLCLASDQPPACRLRAEEEPWSSGDE